MKKLLALVLAGVVLTPAVALAGGATNAALGLGAFAVFNQILGGVGLFGYAQPAPVYAAPVPPPVVYAPPPPPVYYPAPVVVAAPPVVYARPVVVAAPVYYVRPHYVHYAPRPVVVVGPPHRGPHHGW